MRWRFFCVANLSVGVADSADMALSLPRSYAAFEVVSPCDETLLLRVPRDGVRSLDGWRQIFGGQFTWQLWRNDHGSYLFALGPDEPYGAAIMVEQSFQHGEILGAFARCETSPQDPCILRELDIRIYTNWLATKGDFAMHAAGVAESEAGYAFLGPAGVGKSTLAAQVAGAPTVQVLGEDNVIVRRMGSDFMLYGTPWHTDPRMCSPGGVPLTKLFFLERTMPPGVRRVRESEAVQRLILNSFVPFYDREAVNRILDRMTLLAHQVPCYALNCELGSDVLSQIRQA